MLFVRYFSYDITLLNAYEDGVAYFHDFLCKKLLPIQDIYPLVPGVH